MQEHRIRGQRHCPHSPPNIHTPFFQGAWPQHPTEEPGQFQSLGSHWCPLTRLSPAAPGISQRLWTSLETCSPFPKAAPNQPCRPQLRCTPGPRVSRKQLEASKGRGLTLERPCEGEAEEAQESGVASRAAPTTPPPSPGVRPCGPGTDTAPISPRQRAGGGPKSRGSGSNFHPGALRAGPGRSPAPALLWLPRPCPGLPSPAQLCQPPEVRAAV